MRTAIIATLALFALAVGASAQVTFSVRLGSYPTMVAIPGYPVYYAPALDYNYFFYEDRYWVYQDDYWYSSAWYDGPWESVNPYSVPTFMLQVPVRYYRRPPGYFRGWQGDNAPHWGDHWGRSWSQQRSGWDHRPDGPPPVAARLPDYQRQFTGSKYPEPAQQRQLQQSHGQQGATPEQRPATQPQRQPQEQRPVQQPQRPPQEQRPVQQPQRPPQEQRPVQQPQRQPQEQRPVQQPQRQPQEQRPVQQSQRQPQEQRPVQQPQRQPQEQRAKGQRRDQDNDSRDQRAPR
jgi:hypothetical protein